MLEPDLPEVEKLPYASSLCGACQEACPVGIAIPDMLLRLRADAVAAGKGHPVERAGMLGWRAAMNSPSIFRAGGKLAAFGTRMLGRDGGVNWLPPPFDQWTRSRTFPAFAPKSFTELWEERQKSTRIQRE
jgi:L-lactate dehydrogenase complex protein LldF